MKTSSKQQTPLSGQLKFSVDAALLFQLGEELVNRRSVALAELIKNAYDADATRVVLSFSNVRRQGGQIEISDDGTGISFDRLKDTWMRIATSAKLNERVSRLYRRPLTGAKGVGRFAARRIASILEVTSTVASAPRKRGAATKGGERIEVTLNWDAFRPGQSIGDIPAVYRREALRGPGISTGVRLRLKNVRDAWSEEDLAELQRDLLRLVSPVTPATSTVSRKDPGFAIEIESSEFPGFSGDVNESFLSNALGVLRGTLGRDGSAVYRLKFRGRRALTFRPARTRFKALGRSTFEIRFFVYKKDFFAGLPINTREAQERGREEGGVHLYVDRFRVPPYGDPGDDWLKLDEFRGRRLTETPEELEPVAGRVSRPMLLLPGNNQLFGRVSLSRLTNPRIRQTLNRERLIEEEPAFGQLRSFVRLGIDWMTVSYAREFAADRESSGGRAKRNDPVLLLAKAKEAFGSAARDMLPEQRAQILQVIELARQTVAEQQEEIIGELSMLRVLASTGTMIVVFQHQLRGTLSALKDAHAQLSSFVAKLGTQDRSRFADELVRLDRWIETTKHQAQLLGLLMARKSRTRRRRIAIRPIVDSLTQAFESYAVDYGIHIENGIPDGLRTPPMFEAELSAIFVNLLTNAFKAVREQRIRRIGVVGHRLASGIALRVMDTGLGLARKDPEEYFKPFVGDSEPDLILGEGTGLGLKIVRDFVDVYGGKVGFVSPAAPWVTAIELSVPEK